MLPHEEDVEAGQEGLLVHPEVPGHKVLSVVWRRQVMILKRHNKGGLFIKLLLALIVLFRTERDG